jgi:hypothetical protein
MKLPALFLAAGVAALFTACGGDRDVPDSTTTGMQGGTAPTGIEKFGASSGHEAVTPQNLGTEPQEHKKTQP